VPIVSRPHRSNLVAWAADKPRVLVLGADLTASCEADLFRDTYPDRFFSMGMAEANLVGFAAGLAREGFEPFAHTFGVFLTRRVFDQVAMSVGYPNLRVRLMGFLPGLTTPGGVTHQATDDVALMRAIPNIRVLECGDATEVETVLDVCHAVDGPVYVRMLRGEVPRLFPRDEPMVLGQSRLLGEGDDVAVLSSGICTEEALRAVGALCARGLGIRHLHVSTLAPFDDPLVDAALTASRRGIVTVENHAISGGLGTAVAERMAELGLGRKLVRLGVRDTYAHGASKPYLLRKYGMDAVAVVGAVETLWGRGFGIDEAALRHAQVPAPRGTSKVEAL